MKEKKKKPFYKRWWFITIAVLIIIGVFNQPSDEEKAQIEAEKAAAQVKADEEKKKEEKQKEQDELAAKKEAEAAEKEEEQKKKEKAKKEETAKEEKKAEPKEEKPKTLDEKIVDIINKETGKTSNIDKQNRIIKLSVNDNQEGTGKIVVAQLHGDDNLTTNLTRTGMYSDSSKILEKIFSIDGIAEVNIDWRLPLVDSYGKVELGTVINIYLTKETANKIVWENFNYEKFEIVSDDFYLHPALK